MTIWEKRRQASGLSRIDMANELGLNYGRYVSIERGDVKMPSNLIDKFNEIINRGKQNTITSTENSIKADEFWKEMKQKTENGSYVLYNKMKEFNISSINKLTVLLGYSSAGTIHNYLSDRNAASDEFKKRLYSFFNDELNIQIPEKKKSPRKLTKTKYATGNVRGKSNINYDLSEEELDKYYDETDFKKILKENKITNVDIAKYVGVHNSTISNMTSKKYKPGYGVICKTKEYLDNRLNINDTNDINNTNKTQPTQIDINDFMPVIDDKEDDTLARVVEEVPSVVRRYEQELSEIDELLETYKDKIKELEIRQKICVEVLKAIDEFRTTEE